VSGAKPKTRAEHEVIHAALVATGSPLASTYRAVHMARPLSQEERAADVGPQPGVSVKPESKRTAYEQYTHLEATHDPRAHVFGTTHWHEINATRPAEDE
jgi:hypothetical protein